MRQGSIVNGRKRGRGGTFALALRALRRLAILSLVLGASMVAGLPPGGSVAWGQTATLVIVQEAIRDRFVDRVEALGTLRANESVELRSTVTERITMLRFSDGQRVQKGDVLVEMTVDEERAQLREARAIRDEARQQYERVRSLAENRFAAVAQLDERRRMLETAEAQVAAIETRIAERQIVAPFSGVVGLRTISVGALVNPDTLITTLHDDSVMKLDFSLPATFLSTLQPGLPIVARSAAFGNETFRGTVASLDNQIDPVTRSIVARALVPNPDGILRPGMLMSVELLKRPREAVVIGEEALMPAGRDNFVLVVEEDGDKAFVRRRQVHVGGRRPGHVEILSGLQPCDRVVSHGTLRVRDGEEVTIRVQQRREPLDQLLSQTPRG
jgi:membrane fusion protein, multidrug efflux system